MTDKVVPKVIKNPRWLVNEMSPVESAIRNISTPETREMNYTELFSYVFAGPNSVHKVWSVFEYEDVEI